MTLRFNVERIQRCTPTQAAPLGPDRRDGETYVYHHPDIQLAVNVALITGRPLLIEGPSGCGKSTLAFNVALSLKRRYYEFVVTNRSEAQDLLWSIDNIRRLNDANVQALQAMQAYIEPGVLWWAMDKTSAQQRGAAGLLRPEQLAIDPNRGEEAAGAVILIDEIDKADPDMPNSLLVPLGSLQFSIAPIQFAVTAACAPLIVVTTNNERELPPAFLRRCVILQLPSPDLETLVEIAAALSPQDDREFLESIARAVMNLRGAGEDDPVCSTAEYLDTARACRELNIKPTDEQFKRLTRITLQKSRNREESPWA